MILFRYLTREIVRNFIPITSLLCIILMSNVFVRYLNQILGGRLATDLLWRLILLEAPRFFSLLLPFSLFLSILLTYARLYSDHEITALNASGVSLFTLTRLTLPLIAFITLFVTALTFWVSPALLGYRNALLSQTGTAIEIQTMQPGRFQQTNNGQRILYVEQISPDHKQIKNLFLAQLEHSNASEPIWMLITAKRGYQTTNLATKERFFIAQNGMRYQGKPGTNEYYRMHFARYIARINSQVNWAMKQQDTLPIKALLHADPKNKAAFRSELQWRFSNPISVVLLALLAITLSKINPRQGKYLPILVAIILYVVYMNLLIVARDWVENGQLSYHLGLWSIHGLLLLTIISILWYQLYWARTKAQLFRLKKS